MRSTAEAIHAIQSSEVTRLSNRYSSNLYFRLCRESELRQWARTVKAGSDGLLGDSVTSRARVAQW